MTEGQKLVLHHVLLQVQHDDPLKLKSDENSWIFHLYLVKGPKKTTLMRCGFICDIVDRGPIGTPLPPPAILCDIYH